MNEYQVGQWTMVRGFWLAVAWGLMPALLSLAHAAQPFVLVNQ